MGPTILVPPAWAPGRAPVRPPGNQAIRQMWWEKPVLLDKGPGADPTVIVFARLLLAIQCHPAKNPTTSRT